MAAARCFRTLSRLSSHRVAFLAARPSIVGFHCFTRSFVGLPSVAQLKCLQPDLPCMVQFRPFSSGPPTEEEIKETLLYVLKNFDKVNPEQITMEANFIKDLGLDSLDVVEIIMAFEEELGVEISDEEAEKIFNCQDAFELAKKKMELS